MSAPSMPADPLEIELDSDNLVDEPEERTTSQTRRLGSNAQATIELDIADIKDVKFDEGTTPPVPAVVPIDEVTADGDGKPLKPYVPGDLIAQKYKLTRIIGKGGMGSVWQAHNMALDIDVAVKLIRRDRAAPVAADRLLTEARAAARLMHPAIVRVFDFGETSTGDPFIVMELLHGESLSAILRRKKRLSPPVAVQTLLPVAGALASAHAKGIVHRDLKPDNIIVITDENGALVPKIVDFGIAKLLSPELDRQVTVAGEVLGSPDYMSPEQARGSDTIGAATDIWTFSVVLYELMTGKRPFDGANYNALIAAILTNQPLPLLAHGVGDPALSGIIEHGLAKDVAARWPRIRDMGAALASWAIANGVEDDLMGVSIAKQWLTTGARRILTVLPETRGAVPGTGTDPMLPAGQARPAAAAAPVSVAPPTVSRQTVARQPAAAGARRASAQRAILLVIAIVLLGVLGVTVFLLGDRFARLRAATAPSATPTATATATASVAPVVTAAVTAAPAPTDAPAAAHTAVPADSAAAEPEPSASAAPSASVRPWGRLPHKPKAPAAPKNIKF